MINFFLSSTVKEQTSMPPRKFDLDFKCTEEYKSLAAMVRDIAGPQPDYLVARYDVTVH